MNNILVAIELDEHSRKLLAYARNFALAFNAKLWLVHIAPPDPDFVDYHVGPQYIRDGFAQELREEHRKLQQLCEELRRDAIEVEALMIQGPTLEMIMNEAKKLNVEMIMTCSHHRSFLYKAFFGSVSNDLFEQSEIPVLAVPA